VNPATPAAPPPPRARGWRALAPGVLAAALVVIAAEAASRPLGRAFLEWRGLDPAGKNPVPSVPLAVALGLLVSSLVAIPATLRPGLDACARTGLRAGIVLVGFRLSLLEVGASGLRVLPVALAALVTAILVAPRLAAALGLSHRLGLLAAASTGVCGITATLAAAPAVEAEDREVSYTVANVTLYGLLAMLAYPLLAHAALGATPSAAGAFLGAAVHDTAQVMGAALSYRGAYDSEAALAAATVTKLARNASLALVIPLLGWMHARAGGARREGGKASAVPGFVWLFLAAAAVRSLADASPWAASCGPAWKAADTLATHVLLPAAMAAVGLSARLADMRALGWRPLALGAGAAVAAGAAALATAAALAAAGILA
jgi:uncharacterized integral membrane protein (TIGR00698 family)